MFFHCFDRISRKMNRILNNALTRYDLSTSQLLLLNVLAEKKNTIAKEICERMHLDSASVSGLTGRLQKKGLISKKKSAEDSRSTQFILTVRGKELQSLGDAMLKEFDLKCVATMGTKESVLFNSMLEKLEQEWTR